MEQKSNKWIIWLLVILIILVSALIVLVVYKGFFAEKLENNNLNTTGTTETTTTNKTEEQKKLTDEEIKKYLSYVPFSMRYDDAYTGKTVNLNSIDVSALMDTAFRNVEKIIIEDIEECNYSDCAKEQIFNDKLKESYNMDTFKSNEYLDLANGYYYVKALGIGGGEYKSPSKNVSYEIKEADLIIKEQVGIIVESGGPVIVYDGKNIVKEFYNENQIEDSTDYEEVAKEYVKNNINSFNTYKHTFKQHNDGTYYWYSTEVEK